MGSRLAFALLFTFSIAGCVSMVTADENEKVLPPPPPVAEFDPQNKIIPFPNDLLIDPTSGKVSLPASCGESDRSVVVMARGGAALQR